MRRWDGLMDGHLRECEVRGLSAGLVRHRQRELGRFGLWLKARRPRPNLEVVDGELITKYLKGRTAFHAKATLSGVMSGLRQMGEYLVRQSLWNSNPLRWMRGPKLDPRGRLPRRIGRSEMNRLWDAAGRMSGDYARARTIAMLAILYGTGMRRGELSRLDVGHWHPEEGLMEVDGQKTGRPRRVPLAPAVVRCLEAYLPQRHNRLERHGRTEERALFVNRQGQRLSSERMGGIIHGLAEREGIPLVSLHAFRHTCASDLLEGGIRLPEVQQMLGHASVSSTVRYLSIADPQRKEAVARHPINAMLQELEAGGGQ